MFFRKFWVIMKSFVAKINFHLLEHFYYIYQHCIIILLRTYLLLALNLRVIWCRKVKTTDLYLFMQCKIRNWNWYAKKCISSSIVKHSCLFQYVGMLHLLSGLSGIFLVSVFQLPPRLFLQFSFFVFLFYLYWCENELKKLISFFFR